MSKSRRGTSNANARGNSVDRRARRRWLLQSYASNVPGYCRCYRCGVLLDEESLTVDRIVPGCLGGKYVRTNIRPACSECNSETGGALATNKAPKSVVEQLAEARFEQALA